MIGAPLTISPESDSRLDGLLWERAAGNVQCDRPYKFSTTPVPLGNDICKRCRGVHKLLPPQMITISGELLEIDVSVLAEDEHSFITGFKLVYGESMSGINFGYQIPQKQIKIDLRGHQLRGFEVFAGEGGIQAIRPIFDQKYELSHILLTPDGELKAFAGDFDAPDTMI
ncbi:uncharacterized protein N7503_000596 [Penicillium pulvis]|uniref:uncharacterized protein n=1 Tax=Penicillium pulvis TaxID=1562058 RepID=UPI002547EC18|nr:uncharacterized protein N7503_000596 [Penicillium pulvis]KAJ5813846.1 hypothetical protein N7503_000596 [Penicillium pulvis]